MSASVLTAVSAVARHSWYSRAAAAESAPVLFQPPEAAQPARSSVNPSEESLTGWLAPTPTLSRLRGRGILCCDAPRREPREDHTFVGRAGIVPAPDLVDRAQAATAHPRRRIHQADAEAGRERARLGLPALAHAEASGAKSSPANS